MSLLRMCKFVFHLLLYVRGLSCRAPVGISSISLKSSEDSLNEERECRHLLREVKVDSRDGEDKTEIVRNHIEEQTTGRISGQVSFNPDVLDSRESGLIGQDFISEDTRESINGHYGSKDGQKYQIIEKYLPKKRIRRFVFPVPVTKHATRRRGSKNHDIRGLRNFRLLERRRFSSRRNGPMRSPLLFELFPHLSPSAGEE